MIEHGKTFSHFPLSLFLELMLRLCILDSLHVGRIMIRAARIVTLSIMNSGELQSLEKVCEHASSTLSVCL
jgi:hypothetical protein